MDRANIARMPVMNRFHRNGIQATSCVPDEVKRQTQTARMSTFFACEHVTRTRNKGGTHRVHYSVTARGTGSQVLALEVLLAAFFAVRDAGG